MIRPLLGALAFLAVAAPAASASDAEIFATSDTAVITDPGDPRLKDNLKQFARQVERIVADGGGDPRGSQLLDGVFFDGTATTFERSREFDVDRVSEDELHTIADTIRARFGQQSVLTFDTLPAGSRDADAVQLDVPGVTAAALRTGLLDDAEARERLFGGSVTQDRHLLLVASLEDADLARRFAKRIGGDVKRASVKYGKREFVSGPLPARVERGTLVVSGTGDDDAIGLVRRPGRIEVTLGEATFAFAAHKVDRIRVDGGADRTTAYGSEGDDQISFGAFGLLGPTFIQLVNPSLDRSLTVDGRGGDDIISASSAAVDLTLVGGSGDNVLIGGPGDEHLVGGDGFDDVSGGPGEDVALLGGGFDRFTWKPGDGSDVVDGGASRDSLSITGTGAGEAYALDPDGRGLRFTVGDVALALAGIEEIDPVLGGGADTFAVGDLSRTGAQLVNVSHAEAIDTLAVDGGAGQDTLDTSAFTAGTIGVEFAGERSVSGPGSPSRRAAARRRDGPAPGGRSGR